MTFEPKLTYKVCKGVEVPVLSVCRWAAITLEHWNSLSKKDKQWYSQEYLAEKNNQHNERY